MEQNWGETCLPWACRKRIVGPRAQGSGLRAQGLGFKVEGIGFRVSAYGVRVVPPGALQEAAKADLLEGAADLPPVVLEGLATVLGAVALERI